MGFVAFGFATAFDFGLRCGGNILSGSAAMVFGEQAFENFFAGGGADGVADAVVFGEGFDFDEIVAEVETIQTVSVADGDVEFAVQTAQFEDALETGFGFSNGFLADLGDLGGGEVAAVEQVVDVGETKPELAHEGAAVFVVVLAKVGQNGVGGLPEAFWKWKSVKAF